VSRPPTCEEQFLNLVDRNVIELLEMFAYCAEMRWPFNADNQIRPREGAVRADFIRNDVNQIVGRNFPSC
jgi:hypothetical protein